MHRADQVIKRKAPCQGGDLPLPAEPETDLQPDFYPQRAKPKRRRGNQFTVYSHNIFIMVGQADLIQLLCLGCSKYLFQQLFCITAAPVPQGMDVIIYKHPILRLSPSLHPFSYHKH